MIKYLRFPCQGLTKHSTVLGSSRLANSWHPKSQQVASANGADLELAAGNDTTGRA